MKKSTLLIALAIAVIALSGCTQEQQGGNAPPGAVKVAGKEDALKNCQSGFICDFGDGYKCYGTDYTEILKNKIKECPVNTVLVCEQYLLDKHYFTDSQAIIEKSSYEDLLGESRPACHVGYKRTFADQQYSMNNIEMDCFYSLVDETFSCS